MSIHRPVGRRSRGRRAALLGLVPVAVVAVAAVTALAYWTTIGMGNAGASVGTLAATTVTTHEATGTSVALQWDAVAPPAADTVEYYVLRDGGAASAACGTVAAPIAALGCTDTVPTSSAPTDYTYEVVAVWRSWTSTSDSVDVHVKGAQTIVFTSTAPSGAKVGGATYEVTATGGGSGNPVTFSIDPSAAAVCSVAGSTVSFTAVGTCIVTANQAGNTDYEPAAQGQQSFTVAKGDAGDHVHVHRAVGREGGRGDVRGDCDGRRVGQPGHVLDRPERRGCLLGGRVDGELHRGRHLHDARRSGRERELESGAAGAAVLRGREGGSA